jgi:tripartite-type tricarboxylate transporter receptor subunit TctC
MGTKGFPFSVIVFSVIVVGIGSSIANPASAQTFPDRVIKLVVPYPPAGPADVAARLIATPLSAQLGQSVIIENAVTDLLGGQIQIGMTSKAVLLPLIQAGKLRALAVTSDVRWPELPDVPTLRESGLEGVPGYLWSGLLAPARTPAAAIAKINAAANEGLKSPEFKAGIAKLGLESRSMTPLEFATKLSDEARDWAAVVKESGVTID